MTPDFEFSANPPAGLLDGGPPGRRPKADPGDVDHALGKHLGLFTEKIGPSLAQYTMK
jgi:hypothetical protein